MIPNTDEEIEQELARHRDRSARNIERRLREAEGRLLLGRVYVSLIRRHVELENARDHSGHYSAGALLVHSLLCEY